MNSKVLIASLLGAVTAFILGYLLWGMILADFMSHNSGSATGVMKTKMGGTDMLSIFLGNLAISYLFVHIFTKWAGISTFSGGLRAGALIGLLMALGFDLVSYGANNIMNMNATIVDIIAGTAYYAIIGGVIGGYLNMNNKA